GAVLVARNTYYAPVEVVWQLTEMSNVSTDAPPSGSLVVAARSDRDLMTLRRTDPDASMRFDYEMRYVLGSPDAAHVPGQPYRLPYALASGHPVSQAPPDTLTHVDPGSQHAIDFAMP